MVEAMERREVKGGRGKPAASKAVALTAAGLHPANEAWAVVLRELRVGVATDGGGGADGALLAGDPQDRGGALPTAGGFGAADLRRAGDAVPRGGDAGRVAQRGRDGAGHAGVSPVAGGAADFSQNVDFTLSAQGRG